jgi:hypothetical protein
MRLESAKCKTADIAKQAAAVAAGQFKTYNFGLDSRHGAPLYGSLLLQLLILLVVANGSAVVAKKLLGVVFGRPLDGGTHVGLRLNNPPELAALPFAARQLALTARDESATRPETLWCSVLCCP